jgi:hypothetical protein
MRTTAYEGMSVAKLLASARHKDSLAVHLSARGDNVLRGMLAAADGVEAVFFSVGMPCPATAFFTRAMGRKRLHVYWGDELVGAASRLHVLRFQRRVGVPRFLNCFL